MVQIFNALQKSIYKLKSKNGMSTIEIVIGMMIFLIALSFLTDLLILLWKFNVLAQTTTQVARISGIQGGVLSAAPPYWPGGNSNYVSISEMENIVREKFETADLSIDEWSMEIGGRGTIGRDGLVASEAIDYKDTFQVVGTIDYQWLFTSHFIPFITLEHTITAKRPAMSEWRYNYSGTWEGE